MASNKNLFYNLYSKSNNVISAGYTCNTAIDENDTSFDITVDSQGNSAGVITDSNGNLLSGIDLSSLHVSNITLYNNESKILLPHSCYILQGLEFGLARAEYHFIIPKRVREKENYEYYLGCDFDILYNDFSPKKLHIHVDANGHDSLDKLINKELNNKNVLISSSILIVKHNNYIHHYLTFIALKDAYFYYIDNLRINMCFQSEDYPNSPFKRGIEDTKIYIYNLLIDYHPVTKADEPYNPDTYEINCDLYTWLLCDYILAADEIESFNKMILCIHNAIDNPDEAEYWIELANIAIKDTVYDKDGLFDGYSIENIEIIRNLISEIKEKIVDCNSVYNDFYWLMEDKHLRVPLMKYPNGAFRGIVLIPDWPSNTDDYEYASLWINHIKSTVTLYELTHRNLYKPHTVLVLSNATLVKEEKLFRLLYPEFNNINVDNSVAPPCGCLSQLLNEYDENIENCVDLNRVRLDDIMDDLSWMGNTYYSKKDIIGLFRYMQYVNDNDLWNKVGDAYMIIGKDDDPQSQNLNLPTSLLIYNPNDVPIRIKYMIFS